MEARPFFTILTASLDMACTLRKTIASVRDQDFQEVEHIVVDGGSTDGTLELLAGAETAYNLKWISGPDRGVPDAFNRGLAMAGGTYVVVIQADDYLLDRSILGRVKRVIEEHNADIYSFPVMKGVPGRKGRRLRPIPLRWYIRFRNIFPHQGVFIRRRLFDTVGMYDVRYSIAMDYDFLYRALNRDCSIRFERMPVAFMGAEGLSTDRRFLPDRLAEERRIHAANEQSRCWHALQQLFWFAYRPYKLKFRRPGRWKTK